MMPAGPDGREWTWEQVQAWFVCHEVRGALEMFHGGGAMDPETGSTDEGFITDRQMQAMNIVIRKTVYDAVTRLSHPADGDNGMLILMVLGRIDDYMEPPGTPELELAYERIENGEFDPVGFVPDCKQSSPDLSD